MSWYKEGQLTDQELAGDLVQVEGWGMISREQALQEAIQRSRSIAEALEAGRKVSENEFELAKIMYRAYLS